MPTPKRRIRIAIVDDHKLFRRGVIKLLQETEDYEILFEAEDGKMLTQMLQEQPAKLPDIIIMDINMPTMNGYETMNWLREHYPDMKVLVISMIVKETEIYKMIKLGVRGYLSKDIEPEDVEEALRAIWEKGYYYTEFLTGKLIHSLRYDDGIDSPEIDADAAWLQFNERHRDFIRFACSEMTYDEIARAMYLSPKTIDGYREFVFDKLKVRNRVGLVLQAVKKGWVNL
jgi:DNA-binding NarL/FixJ family response regulator